MSESADVVRRVPDMDLGSVFGNRTDGLGGLAPRRPRPVPSPTPVPPPAVEEQDATAAPGGDADGSASRSPRAKPTSDGGGVVATVAPAPVKTAAPRSTRTPRAAGAESSPVPRLVILQLPNATADRLREGARQRGVTYKELALDAVEATAHRLPELLAAQRPQARTGGLFAGERVATQARPEGRRQVSIKLSEASITALDNLATQHGARSRSELVATALDAYLAD